MTADLSLSKSSKVRFNPSSSILSILISFLIILPTISKIQLTLSQTITSTGYPTTDYKISKFEGSFDDFTILTVTHRTSNIKLNIMYDGKRRVEDSGLSNYGLNLYTGVGFGISASTAEVYSASHSNRSLIRKTVDKAAGVMFSAGKWTVLQSTQAGSALVFKTSVFPVEISTASFKNCSAIDQRVCVGSDNELVYCLEVSMITGQHYLTYYKMPTCEKLIRTLQVPKDLTASQVATISVQGQVFAFCVTEKTSLNAVCEYYDLSSSLWALENPEKAVPVTSIQYTIPGTIIGETVVKINHYTDIGCVVFVTKVTVGGNHKLYYKCTNDLVQGVELGITAGEPVMKYNFLDKRLDFLVTDDTVRSLKFQEVDLVQSPDRCLKYNSQIRMCTECEKNSFLKSTGDCEEPVRYLLNQGKYEVSFNTEILLVQFKFEKGDGFLDLIRENIKNTDLLYFEDPQVMTSYQISIIENNFELEESQRLRIHFSGKKITDSIKTKFGLKMRGSEDLSLFSKNLNDPSHLKELTVPPFIFYSAGATDSFKILFDHLYSLAFFLQIYLILVRPLIKSWREDPTQMWLGHFVLCLQTLFLLGYNSWDLKGYLEKCTSTAATSSFRHLSWDYRLDITNGKFPVSKGYFQGKLTTNGGHPNFLQQLFAHFILYFGCLILGIITPIFKAEIRAIRTASLICFLPQAWFMFFIGAFNLFLGKASNPLNYSSFILSLFHVLSSLLELAGSLWPPAIQELRPLINYPKCEGSWDFDVRDFSDKKMPLFYHADLIVAIITGSVLGLTPNSGTLQGIILTVVYAARIGLHFYQFKFTTSRRMTKLKIGLSSLMFIFVLLAVILHSKKEGKEGVMVLTVMCLIAFFGSIAICLAMLVIRVVSLFTDPFIHRVKESHNKEGEKGGNDDQRAPASVHKREGDSNQSVVKLGGILDKFINNVDYSKINESEQPSEVNIKFLDQSENKLK